MAPIADLRGALPFLLPCFSGAVVHAGNFLILSNK